MFSLAKIGYHGWIREANRLFDGLMGLQKWVFLQGGVWGRQGGQDLTQV